MPQYPTAPIGFENPSYEQSVVPTFNTLSAEVPSVNAVQQGEFSQPKINVIEQGKKRLLPINKRFLKNFLSRQIPSIFIPKLLDQVVVIPEEVIRSIPLVNDKGKRLFSKKQIDKMKINEINPENCYLVRL